MKENKYDDPRFFEKYSHMSRSEQGLQGAGEWLTLAPLLPAFAGKRVLDLGCGYGWHCAYAADQGAASVIGVDLSAKMLETARQKNARPQVQYQQGAIEDAAFPDGSFDVVLSSLALHYVADFDAVARRVYAMVAPGGWFVFSAEHPRPGPAGLGLRRIRAHPAFSRRPLLLPGAAQRRVFGRAGTKIPPHADRISGGAPLLRVCAAPCGGAAAARRDAGYARHARRAAPPHDAHRLCAKAVKQKKSGSSALFLCRQTAEKHARKVSSASSSK